jgi:hypothetical protein
MDRPDTTPQAQAQAWEPQRAGAEFQFLLIALVLVVMIAVAGIPGGPEKTVGDGSVALKRGWAEAHAAANAPIEEVAPDAAEQDSTGR